MQDGSGELTLEEINKAPEETQNQLKAEGGDLVALNESIWVFPQIGVPPNHEFQEGFPL